MHVKKLSPLLKLAIRNGLTTASIFQLKKQGAINSRDKNGQTPLMIASAHGRVEIVKFLLSKDADCEQIDLAGNSAYTLATKNGHLAIAEELKSHTNIAAMESQASAANDTSLLENKQYETPTIEKAESQSLTNLPEIVAEESEELINGHFSRLEDPEKSASLIESYFLSNPVTSSADRGTAEAMQEEIIEISSMQQEQEIITSHEEQLREAPPQEDAAEENAIAENLSGWESEEISTAPPDDHYQRQLAEEAQQTISQIRFVDEDQNWDEVELLLPEVRHLPFRDDDDTLHQLLSSGLDSGRLNMDQLEHVCSQLFFENSELALSRLVTILSNLGIEIDREETDQNFSDIEINQNSANEAIIDEALYLLEQAMAMPPDHHLAIQKHFKSLALLDKPGEERLAQQMDYSLIAISKLCVAITDDDYVQVTSDVANKPEAIRNTKDFIVPDEEEELDEKSDETDPELLQESQLSFSHVLTSVRNGNHEIVSNLHVPRPTSSELETMLNGLSKIEPTLATNIEKHLQAYLSYRDKFVQANLRLTLSVARRYQDRGVDLADLFQEGVLGLLKAVEKYDYRRGFKFSTYAVWWIRQAVTRAIADKANIIRLPVHIIEKINKVEQFAEDLNIGPNRKCVTAKLAHSLNLPESEIRKTQKHSLLQKPFTEFDEDLGCCSTLNQYYPDTIFQTALYKSMRERVAEALDTLTERESIVVRYRFGIGGSDEMTLEEVGQIMGVTRERIRQIEAKALRKLRAPSRSEILHTFMDR